jgi:hypothetical protein
MFAQQGHSQVLHQESMQSQFHAPEGAYAQTVFQQRLGQQMMFHQFGHSLYTRGANSGANSQMLAQQNAHPQIRGQAGLKWANLPCIKWLLKHLIKHSTFKTSLSLSYPTGRCTYRLFILVYVQ